MADNEKQQEPTPAPEPAPEPKKKHWWHRLGKAIEEDAGNALGEAFANRQ